MAGELSLTITQVSGKLGDLNAVVTTLVPGLDRLAGASAGFGASLARLGASLASGRLPQAVADLAGSFGRMTGAALPFVQALNPGLLKVFNQAVGELSATIGQAFEPVFAALIPIIRQVADVLGPVLRDVGPLLGELATALGQLLMPVVRVLAGALRALLPVIKLVTEAIERLANFIDSIINDEKDAGAGPALGRAAAGATVGGLVGSIIPGIGTFLGAALGALGADLLAALSSSDRKGGRAVPAVKNSSFGDIDALRRNAILAAQMAGGTVEEKQLKEQKTTNELIRDVKNRIDAALRRGIEQGPAAIPEPRGGGIIAAGVRG